jgi:hypothetical protein
MIIDFNQVLGYLNGLPIAAAVLLLVALSVTLAFAGRQLIKALAFIITGIIVGVVGASIGMSYLGTFGAILGGAAGFLIGGFLGILFVFVGIGIALGYLGYSATNVLVGSELLAIVAGAVLFIVGVVLANELLSIATAILGGVLLFDVMTYLGMGFVIPAISAIMVAVLGAWVQTMTDTSRPETVKTTQTVTTRIDGTGSHTSQNTTQTETESD